jgi:isochorismate synthase
MASMIDALRYCVDHGLAFAAFRWNGHTHLWAGGPLDMPVLSHGTMDPLEGVFILRPFQEDGRSIAVLVPRVMMDLDDEHLDLEPLHTLQQNGIRLPEKQPTPWERHGYEEAVEQARERMAQSLLNKVVLSRSITVPFHLRNLPELFVEGLKAHPHAFVCMANTPFGLWLGASPERLVAAHGSEVKVDAIAGTLPVESAPPRAAEWGTKERVEQEMVTLAVEEAFAELGLGDISWQGPDVLPSGNIAHLHTRLKARLGAVPLAQLAERLHPTPAVCGTPTHAALRFILEHEPRERMLYGGYWGPWNVDGRTELFVNIRCLFATEEHVHVQVGGGITADSRAADEWHETELKAQAWLKPIAAVQARIS